MAQPGPCPKCGGSMTEGFVMGRTYSSSIPALAAWIEGKPERSIWTGLRLKGRQQKELAAYRCTRCGFVETYAIGDALVANKTAERKLALVAAILAAVMAVVAASLIMARGG